MKLAAVQAMISTLFAKQFSVGALLHHLSLVDHDHPIQ
jgi:hypothetical protein